MQKIGNLAGGLAMKEICLNDSDDYIKPGFKKSFSFSVVDVCFFSRNIFNSPKTHTPSIFTLKIDKITKGKKIQIH